MNAFSANNPKTLGTKNGFSVVNEGPIVLKYENSPVMYGSYDRDSSAFWFRIKGVNGEKAFDEVADILDYAIANNLTEWND